MPTPPIARLAALIVAVFGLALALGACGDDDSSSTTATSTTTAGDCQDVEAPRAKNDRFKKPEQVLEKGESATATVETSCGSFVIALDTENSPKTANSF